MNTKARPFMDTLRDIEVAGQYGGGGHRNAAGFRVSFDHELAGAIPTGGAA